MIFNFFSTTPIILEVNNKDFQVSNSKQLNINNVTKLIIKCFPLADIYKGYSFCLNVSNNIVTTNNTEVKILKLGNNEIFVVLPTLYIDNSLLLLKEDITIKNGITLYYNNQQLLKESFCAINCKHIIFNEHDVFLLQGLIDNFIIIMLNNNILLHSKYMKIEIYEDKIMLIEDLKDMFNHGLVKELSFIDNIFSLKNEYSVYIEDYYNQSINANSIVNAFLDCGKAKNLSLIDKYLDESLKNNLTQQNFNKYFGNYKNYFTLDIVNNTQKVIVEYPNHISLFNFCLKNNKIIDIEKI